VSKFTKEEKRVLIFLVACLFIGTGILYHKKLRPNYYTHIEFDEKEINKSKITKVNINTAGALELIQIKNIGPVTAGRIINYREEYGPFRDPEDIKKIKGIGDKTYEQLKKQIVTE